MCPGGRGAGAPSCFRGCSRRCSRGHRRALITAFSNKFSLVKNDPCGERGSAVCGGRETGYICILLLNWGDGIFLPRAEIRREVLTQKKELKASSLKPYQRDVRLDLRLRNWQLGAKGGCLSWGSGLEFWSLDPGSQLSELGSLGAWEPGSLGAWELEFGSLELRLGSLGSGAWFWEAGVGSLDSAAWAWVREPELRSLGLVAESLALVAGQ